MALTITDKELQELHLNEKELKIEIAAHLYDVGKLSLGKAANFANLDKLSFQKELAKRNVFLKYSINDLHHDLDTLKSLNL